MITIDQQKTAALLHAEKKAGNKNKVPWSEELISLNFLIRFWQAARSQKTTGRIVDNQTAVFKSLMRNEDKPEVDWKTLSLQDICKQLRQARTRRKKLLKDACNIRLQFLENRVAYYANKDKKKEANILYQMIKAYKQAEC